MEESDWLASPKNERAADSRSASATPAERTPRAAEGAADTDLADDDRTPSVGDQFGEAAGGISGVFAGAAIGSLGGPIGTVIGGIAGAVGGWWTGRAISEAASNFSRSDDEESRSDFETRADAVPSTPLRSYELVRPAYQLGYLASRNPEYAGQSFEDIEPHLERGWNGNAATEAGDWSAMRDYARTAYVRGVDSGASATTRANDPANDASRDAGSAEPLAG